VNAVEISGKLIAEACVLKGYDFKSGLCDVINNFTRMSVGNGIRLDHGKSAVGCHS
jgi:hypothetical protein